jgi:hypothetical protein
MFKKGAHKRAPFLYKKRMSRVELYCVVNKGISVVLNIRLNIIYVMIFAVKKESLRKVVTNSDFRI